MAEAADTFLVVQTGARKAAGISCYSPKWNMATTLIFRRSRARSITSATE